MGQRDQKEQERNSRYAPAGLATVLGRLAARMAEKTVQCGDNLQCNLPCFFIARDRNSADDHDVLEQAGNAYFGHFFVMSVLLVDVGSRMLSFE